SWGCPVTDLDNYIPHRPPVRWVERRAEVNIDRAVTEAEVRIDSILYDPELEGVSSWAGLEYLAQTAAVWVGAECRRRSQPIEPAFLISSRHYNALRPVFARGETLRVCVTPDLIDRPLVAFAGTISNARDEQLVEAVFAAFQPEDLDTFLKAGVPVPHSAWFRSRKMNRPVLVTGSSRGIGKAIAQQLAREGFDVAVHCRGNLEQAQAVAEEIKALGRRAWVLQFDVADRAAAERALTAHLETEGA